MAPCTSPTAAAHEAAFLGRDEDRVAIQRSPADDDAVVERRRGVELAQVRTDHPFSRRQDLTKAAVVEKTEEAFAGTVLVIAVLVVVTVGLR